MIDLFRKTATTKTIFFVVADVIFVAISVWMSFLLRFDFNIPGQYFPLIYRTIGLFIIFILPVFYFQKLYSFSWAYVSANELISLFTSTTIIFIFVSFVIYISHHFPYFNDFPRSILFISYVLIFLFCGSLRLSKRIYLRILGQNSVSENNRTLIVGAGDAGEQILRSIISSNKSHYYPIGFVDDNPIKKGVMIHGLKVLGKISDIQDIAERYKIKQLIIALPSANSKKMREAVEAGKKGGIWKIKIAPPIAEIIRGQVSFKNLKNVEVEDLLGREEVVLDDKQVENFIKGKRIMVTGASGSIGSELVRQVSKFSPSLLLLLDQDETGVFTISNEIRRDYPALQTESLVADVTDKERIGKIFEASKPEIVFHAAAYKHVFLMEQNAQEAVRNNIFGTKVVAEACIENGSSKFVLISTDKAVNPSSIMGATKRVCEMLCQALNKQEKTKFISVRFGNVLNSRGSVIPIFREQIRRGGPIEVTHPEMQRYFMLTSEACLLVMQAGAMGKGGEVFVLDMGKPVKIMDLAKEMIRLSGLHLDKDITITITGQKPGEKLFEEILTAEEGVAATQNRKIFVAKLSEVDAKNVEDKIDTLKGLLNSDKEKICEAIFNIVPTFKR